MNDIPHCAISERGMVGCIVTSAGDVLDEMPMTAEHFFTPTCRSVFEAAQNVHRSGKDVDMFTVQSELGAAGVEGLGGAHAVIDFCHYPSVAMASSFYTTLCDMLTLRRAQAMGRWIEGEIDRNKDVSGLCSEINRRSSSLHITVDSDNVLMSAIKNVKDRCARMTRGEKPRRMMTPITAWNRLFNGLADGNYYGIASRPGLGKTAMMEQMISALMQLDVPVVCFEKDMSPQKLIERMACREAKVPYWRYDRETLEQYQIDEVEKWADAIGTTKLKVYSPMGMTAESMCAIIRREVRVNKVRAVFLDHIQCLRFPGHDIRAGLTAASLTIRQCVTETGVPHVILAHLNRDAARNGRPQPEQIKEFDQFFGDVDALALLWSEVEAADLKPGMPRPMKLYAAKNRGGACTEEDLSFDGPLLTFK